MHHSADTILLIFSIKTGYSNDRSPYPVYFDTLLLIIYLSAIETLICDREVNFTSTDFAQTTIDDFRTTVLNSYWHCLRKMPQKLIVRMDKWLSVDAAI